MNIRLHANATTTSKTRRYNRLPSRRRTSGRMTFRLQPNRSARHNVLNDEAMILHHNPL